MNENMSLTFMDENGRERKCDVLFTYECDETGKNYIVYTDYSRDKEDQLQVFASIYTPGSDELIAIEAEKEWMIIESIFEKLQAELRTDSCEDLE